MTKVPNPFIYFMLGHDTEYYTEGSSDKLPTWICNFWSFGLNGQKRNFSLILLNYAIFEGIFFIFSWAKQIENTHFWVKIG